MPGDGSPLDPSAFDVRHLEAPMRAAGINTQKLAFRLLPSGQSQRTFTLLASSVDGEFVVRGAHSGGPPAAAIERELCIMQGLGASAVPIPRVVASCGSNAETGPFFLTEYVRGRRFKDPAMPGVGKADRRAMYADINRVLAALHNADYRAAGLARFERGHYLARHIDRWTHQFRSAGRASNEMEELSAWLSANLPLVDDVALVHRDFRIHNLVFHPTKPEVVAVLDWSLAMPGNPFAEIAYYCTCWRLLPGLWCGFAGSDIHTLGIPQERAFTEDYCQARGIQRISAWEFYLAYNFFRMAASLPALVAGAPADVAVTQSAVDLDLRVRQLAGLGWRSAQCSLAA